MFQPTDRHVRLGERKKNNKKKRFLKTNCQPSVPSVLKHSLVPQGLLRGAARRRRHGAVHQEAERGGRRGVQVLRHLRLQPETGGQGRHLSLQ